MEYQEKLDAIQLAEKQLALLKADLDEEFTYPMLFKNNDTGTIVKFTGLHSGKVVVPGNDNYIEGKSYCDRLWHSHTDSSVWTQVPEPFKQWEPQGGRYYITSDGEAQEATTLDSYRLFGTEYQTKQQAEWARDQMRRFHRLLAYVAEFDVDENGVQWMPDWSNRFQSKHFVYYSNDDMVWYTDRWSKKQDITVLMSEQCAEDLVIRLNEGSVVL